MSTPSISSPTLPQNIVPMIVTSWKEDWMLWLTILSLCVFLFLEWIEQTRVKPFISLSTLPKWFLGMKESIVNAFDVDSHESFVSGVPPMSTWKDWKTAQSLSAIQPSASAFAQTSINTNTSSGSLQGASFGIYPPNLPYHPTEQQLNAIQQPSVQPPDAYASLLANRQTLTIPSHAHAYAKDEEQRQSLSPLQLPQEPYYVSGYQPGRIRQPVNLAPGLQVVQSL